MKQKTNWAFSLLLSAFAAVAIYLTVHELGHLLVALANGASIQRFSLLHARVWWVGGSFGPLAAPLADAAGSLLPVLLALAALCFYKKQNASPVYQSFCLMGTVVTAASLLSWVALPVLALAGRAPAGDDVTKFLQNSSLPPLAVSLCAGHAAPA